MTKQTKNAVVRARISSFKKEKAGQILRKLGITDSQAIDMFYSKIISYRGIPFDLSLEEDDKEENYTKIKDAKHLKGLLNL